jgi:hypothetical protein
LQGILSSSNNQTLNWAAISNMNLTGSGTFTANNSLGTGKNTGITIHPPPAAGAAFVIGG